MKFVFYRPHANIWFRNTVPNIRKGYEFPNKYAALLDFALSSSHEIYFSTALVYEDGFRGLLSRLRDIYDLIAWCVIHKISLRRSGLVLTRGQLARKDVLFAMHYGNFTFETEAGAEQGVRLARGLADLPLCKVIHMTHFAYCPQLGAGNLKILNPDLLVAESNLDRVSDFFRKYFPGYAGAFKLLPYVPAPRFVCNKPFDERINKLVVTGSITYKMKGREFIDFYKVDELQPMRRRLYEEASRYLNEMSCQVIDLNEQRAVTSPRPRQSLLKRLSRRAARLFRRDRVEDVQQNYYRKNIVETYNEFCMFAVPEEICDLPAIGFVEGMACGCAYFGIDSPMYRDLGLLPDIHYVTYDGTVEGLMDKVRYYQEHHADLERIAREGCEFVRSHLSANTVYLQFFKHLESATCP